MKHLNEYINQLEQDGILLGIISNENDINCMKIAGVTANTKELKQDDIFVCIKGFSVDGHNLAQEAVIKGAIAIVVEHELKIDNAVQIIVKDSRKAMAILVKHYYNDPASSFKLIGITGTNGKTTCAWLVMQILQAKGYKVAMIGTLGYYINGVKYDSERTTPDIIDLNRIFSQIREEKVEYVVMEVSSHAIALSRVYGLNFYITAFTNLSQDHLDFHHDMQDYAQTKLRLFTELQDENGFSVINIDDDFGQDIASKINIRVKPISINVNKKHDKQTYLAKDIKFDLQKTHFVLNSPLHSNESLITRLVGDFNISNCITSIAITDEIADKCGQNMRDIIAELKSAKGRLELVPNDLGLGIYIDYAHTPDAVENVLKNLNKSVHQRIITLIGAGGNRDKSKRPLMTQAALHYSDLVILCDDNPRDEEPFKIIENMLEGIDHKANILIIRDRKKALKSVVSLAKKGDIVLIAGKGHETYQEIKGEKHPFDEYAIISEYLLCHDKETESGDTLPIPIDLMNFSWWFGLPFEQARHGSFDFIEHIITDSRSIKEHSLFVALKGDRFDGGDFCREVLKTNHTFCLVNKNYHGASSLEKEFRDRIIFVDDTQEAYGLLAHNYLRLFGIKVIALTGSTGKTTTKEYLYHILSERYKVLTNKGNENNLIGVPKTIFALKAYHEMALFELGTNHFGEIKALAEITEPDISLIINIGAAHLEFFGDEDGVFKEKSELFRFTKDTIIFPCNDRRFDKFKQDNIHSISVGECEDADYRVEILKETEQRIDFSINQEEYFINDNVRFKVQNVAFAIAVAKKMGFDHDEIQSGIIKPLNISYRMKKIEINGSLWLADCYNANPVSMKSAIEYWVNLQKEKEHFAVLGDMLELGDKSEFYHQEIGELLEKHKLNQHVYSVGKLSKAFNSKQHYMTVGELISSGILNEIPEGSVVLIKASNGIQLQKLIER
ncbi:MAG TPA: UDP-N-acetylmuramoyl-L-alanyl-D-glutamate--2,6-diaminopimelate ligase [Candidatus Cloacimonadota bacterium]|jgi:UDP-N-acetylmuramyl-tripeptide synthetase/UDP-N-acetylmuramoyl-tripeptide--D-alanyl-D-alanine ligase|nr:UDP-N-acetylmuramoyl-L-alanyl-D-glutamate--2,6-diaminopimelate ligase [Candidatus Cloacimonadales bacterium]HPY95743.1 UDP-N-acetylmuramoyl-L-alanyl-D-glutamate--2,6-diaminopimelate ligase [Candidatus Cloacimonadota bacterium]HQB40273.1 UDP-N-acetylmuramoyl-L-alanyl-D-glutamate--2,6-diaminopimelate ligase [Candidatus Cloacimonadota bacterium]